MLRNKCLHLQLLTMNSIYSYINQECYIEEEFKETEALMNDEFAH